VSKAVGRGVAWLKKQQSGGEFGSGPGETALALLALRHSGLPAGDKACTRAAKSLERSLPDGTVYGAALGTLALLEQDRKTHLKKIRKLVGHLAQGQCKNGQWSYAYRATARKKSGDNSNTQIAILALAAARRRRIAVPDACFEKLHAYLVGSQNEDGGFGYSHNQRSRSYGSMTAGGAMALTLCGNAKPGAETQRALAWLGRGFKPGRNRDAGLAFGKKKGKRSDSFWKHYWLWSVERAGDVCGVSKLGRHDWYALGARYLIDTQRDDGAWRDPEKPIQATCFALLFFARSARIALTPRAGDTAVTPGGR